VGAFGRCGQTSTGGGPGQNSGGSNGDGAPSISNNAGWGGGGAGWNSNGGPGDDYSVGGKSWEEYWVGATAIRNDGGFGGGGSGFHGAGGGGGYSGGGIGDYGVGGGGGGSYNTGTDLSWDSNSNTGHGKVIITKL